MTRVTLFSLLSGDPCLHSVIAIQVFLYMFIFLLRINKPQNILPKHVQVWLSALAGFHIDCIDDLKPELKPGVKLTFLKRILQHYSVKVTKRTWYYRSERRSHEKLPLRVQYLKVQQFIVEIWQGKAKSPNVWELEKKDICNYNHALKNKGLWTATLESGNDFPEVRHLKMCVVIILFSGIVLLKPFFSWFCKYIFKIRLDMLSIAE